MIPRFCPGCLGKLDDFGACGRAKCLQRRRFMLAVDARMPYGMISAESAIAAGRPGTPVHQLSQDRSTVGGFHFVPRVLPKKIEWRVGDWARTAFGNVTLTRHLGNDGWNVRKDGRTYQAHEHELRPFTWHVLDKARVDWRGNPCHDRRCVIEQIFASPDIMVGTRCRVMFDSGAEMVLSIDYLVPA